MIGAYETGECVVRSRGELFSWFLPCLLKLCDGLIYNCAPEFHVPNQPLSI